MKKVLDFHYPIITTYTNHAHMIGILETNEKTYPWIFSNYIQIYINKNLNENEWGDFYFPMPYEVRPAQLCKWLVTQVFSDGYISHINGGVINFIIDCINNNSYVDLMVNYRYIAGSYAYEVSSDRVHDILVWGYDESKEVFYCSDFMYKENNKYLSFECSFSDLNNAYSNYYTSNNISYFGNNVVYTYTLKSDIDYEYDTMNILHGIEDYLYANVPEYWKNYNVCNRKKIAFGIDYYDVLIDYLSNNIPDLISVKLLYLLCDHKKIMISRLQFLEKQNFELECYIQQYMELSSKINKLVNLAIKYNLSHHSNIIVNIIEGLKQVKMDEKKVLTELIGYISSLNRI